MNPTKVDADRLRRTVTGALAEAGWPEPLWYETTVDDPGQGQARQAIEAGAEVVFVCGGDGTVMACVNALVGTDVAMAVLPVGTGNLLAANLGLSGDVAAGIEVAIERGAPTARRGRGRRPGLHRDGRDGLRRADAGRHLRDDQGADRLAGVPDGGVRHLRDRPMRVSIRIDDEPPLRRRARTVLVANVGRLQGGVRLLADAEPDDG